MSAGGNRQCGKRSRSRLGERNRRSAWVDVQPCGHGVVRTNDTSDDAGQSNEELDQCSSPFAHCQRDGLDIVLEKDACGAELCQRPLRPAVVASCAYRARHDHAPWCGSSR